MKGSFANPEKNSDFWFSMHALRGRHETTDNRRAARITVHCAVHVHVHVPCAKRSLTNAKVIEFLTAEADKTLCN